MILVDSRQENRNSSVVVHNFNHGTVWQKSKQQQYTLASTIYYERLPTTEGYGSPVD